MYPSPGFPQGLTPYRTVVYQNHELETGFDNRWVCVDLCHFITRVDSCNRHCNQDAEQFDHHEDVPCAIPL